MTIICPGLRRQMTRDGGGETAGEPRGSAADPVYTGKAMAGLIDGISQKRLTDDAGILYSIIGGLALFAYHPAYKPVQSTRMQESIQLVIESLPYLLKGRLYPATEYWRYVFGLLLGFVLALMRDVPLWPVRWLARAFISRFFRGTPLIAQLFGDLLRPAAIWD